MVAQQQQGDSRPMPDTIIAPRIERVPPDFEGESWRTGRLEGLMAHDISRLLGGIEPDVGDATSDPEKVAYEWWVLIDGCAVNIWSYKGAERVGGWSTYGPASALRAVFGEHYTNG